MEQRFLFRLSTSLIQAAEILDSSAKHPWGIYHIRILTPKSYQNPTTDIIACDYTSPMGK